MLFLLEEIAVELAMIVATFAALGLFVYMLVGLIREHTHARRETADRSFSPTRPHPPVGRRD